MGAGATSSRAYLELLLEVGRCSFTSASALGGRGLAGRGLPLLQTDEVTSPGERFLTSVSLAEIDAVSEEWVEAI